MSSQYEAEKKSVGVLLSHASPNILVPEWQRNYSWRASEVEAFWQDILAFSGRYPEKNIENQEYFLGSIVLVHEGTGYVLLDGQQRLATATMLLSVIRDYLERYNANAALRTQERFISVYDDARETETYKLTLNRFDQEFFRREVQQTRTTDYDPPEPSHDSHRLIRKAREFFVQRFEEKYSELGGGKVAYQWALAISNVLTNHVSLVAVISTDEDNAATVFEVLNDRGIGLSTPDLLRNLLLRRAASDLDRDRIIDCWRTVLEIEDEANRVEDFLRHYWLSHYGDVKTRALYREIKETVIQQEVNSLTLSLDLQRLARVYADIVNARDDDSELQGLLQDIRQLGAKLLYPAILSAYDVASDCSDEKTCVEEKGRFLRVLITFFVRHNVIGKLENSRLETVVFSVAKQLRERRNFDEAIAQIRQQAPTDSQFKMQFRIAEVSRQQTARYILVELEQAKRTTKELSVGKPDKVHIEHIYPQQPAREDRWTNHSAFINRLGNLTLLAGPINQSIRNSEFRTKQLRYIESDLVLTRSLTEYDHWDIECINQRQEMMSEYAVEIWHFPE